MQQMKAIFRFIHCWHGRISHQKVMKFQALKAKMVLTVTVMIQQSCKLKQDISWTWHSPGLAERQILPVSHLLSCLVANQFLPVCTTSLISCPTAAAGTACQHQNSYLDLQSRGNQFLPLITSTPSCLSAAGLPIEIYLRDLLFIQFSHWLEWKNY